MSGMLYLVPTPIGNLGDISPRARETLEQADFIAAEDTRVTLKLLNHLGIKKNLVSYYEHNINDTMQKHCIVSIRTKIYLTTPFCRMMLA